eukprot:gnl/MRDRNA2_/MRDRNA2_59003_c0_seq1.p1 gnl/MRDRNA2_/MRDRNA2_59003_c0~~gnl/MRDRNA2_/MRDRNA2_59003_c0_seq1.p1  ORF type:complete len:383 (+),score=86.24 gnl/MRDRNA2_/MRDRNA2_59003_c0_seq1:92-1150(+)
MSLLQRFCLIFHVLLSTRVCSVQADSSVSPLTEHIKRLEEQSDSLDSLALKAKKAAEEAQVDSNDLRYIGYLRKSAEAQDRVTQEKRTAEKDLQKAKTDELEAQEAKAVIQGPSSNSDTPKAGTRSKLRSEKSTSGTSPVDIQAINVIIICIMASLGFLTWRFIQNKASVARDSSLAAFKESLINPSKEQQDKPDEQTTKCNHDKIDIECCKDDDTAFNSNSSNRSGNEGSLTHVETPRSECSVPEEMALSRDNSLCKTYDEHFALLTPTMECEAIVEHMDNKSREPSLSVPTKLQPNLRVVPPRLDTHSLKVAKQDAQRGANPELLEKFQKLRQPASFVKNYSIATPECPR